MNNAEKLFLARFTGTHLIIRFADAKDCKEFTAAQPCDFQLVDAKGNLTFAEVKGCADGVRFSFARIRKFQWVYADLLTKRQQRYVFYIFNSSQNSWYDVPAWVLLDLKKLGNASVRFDDLTEYRV